MRGQRVSGRTIAAVVVGCVLLLGAGCSSSGADLEEGVCITDPLANLPDAEDIDLEAGISGIQPEIEVVDCDSGGGDVVRLVEEVGPVVMDDEGFSSDACPEGSRDAAVSIIVEGDQAERWCVEDV